MGNPAESEQLDLRPPKTWRRLVPSWLRSLIWVDSAGSYDAFLSYSWKSDVEIAPVIQSVPQRFLCPWCKLRAETVFRDLSCLPAGSSLKNELFDRLDRSSHLIVLASPEAMRNHLLPPAVQNNLATEPLGFHCSTVATTSWPMQRALKFVVNWSSRSSFVCILDETGVSCAVKSARNGAERSG
jgi:hypothetical protein